MSENIYPGPNGTTIVSNGGDPLPGCPESWDAARVWQDRANEKHPEDGGPRWRFDCGFKLDYDGGIMNINSRFYPPKTHSGPKWHGCMHVTVLGDEVANLFLESNSLDELRDMVDIITMDLHRALVIVARNAIIVYSSPKGKDHE